jgi:signal transduction histidine kinase
MKLVPILLASLLLAFVLGAVGIGMRTYGVLMRPDLQYRILPYAPGIPENLVGREGIPLNISKDKQGTQRIMFLGDSLDSGAMSSPFTVTLPCCLVDQNSVVDSANLKFQFPAKPNNYYFKASSPSDSFSGFIPVTVLADYGDHVLVSTSVVDSDFHIPYVCNMSVAIPEEAVGSFVNLQGAVLAGELNAPTGFELYLAVEFGLSDTTYASINSKGKPVLDPVKESPFGVAFAPAYQPDWDPPAWTLALPSTGVCTYIKPYGDPCLFIEVGGSNNGWWTPPDSTRFDENTIARIVKDSNIGQSNLTSQISTVGADIFTTPNTDSWVTFYLYDQKQRKMLDRLRLGEFEPDKNIYYNRAYGYSLHESGEKAREISIVSWPSNSKYSGSLYNYYTVSNTRDLTWSFASHKPWEIVYGKQIVSITPFETSRNLINPPLIGFTLINSDGSAAILRQPAPYTPQEIAASVVLPDLPNHPDDGFSEFLGIVVDQEGNDTYSFATKNSGIVILNQSGDIIHRSTIDDQLSDGSQAYEVHRIISPRRSQVLAEYPVVVALGSEKSRRLCRILANDKWIPAWNHIELAGWSILSIMWLVGTIMITRRMEENEYVAPEDHEEAIDMAHGQRTVQTRARLGQIADSLAHDLNTPLDAIRKNLELLRESQLDDSSEKLHNLDLTAEENRIFINILNDHLENPVSLDLTELNRRSDSLEEYLEDSYPSIAPQADLFARNNFDKASTRDFIDTFGPERSIQLIKLLDSKTSIRKAISNSLDQISLSLGIANRLKNLTSKKAFDLRMGVDTALQLLQSDLVSKKISIEKEISDVPGIYEDPSILIETITIIVQNAIDMLPGGGKIKIRITRQGDIIRILIGNNGPPIPVESIPKIWDRGFSERKAGGHGLGLYIARNLIRDVGGSIGVKSDSEWTEFEVILPTNVRPD